MPARAPRRALRRPWSRSLIASLLPPGCRDVVVRGLLSDEVLDGFVSGLAGAYAIDLLERGDEDLAVPHLAGLCRLDDRLDRALDELVGDCDLDLDLGQEVDDVLRAAVELRMPAL